MNRDQVRLAKLIATVAHAAKGQKRADKMTPYIVHPARVAALCAEWAGAGLYKSEEEVLLCQATAWLHDVLEDTRLTREDLIQLGMAFPVVNLVDILTKKNRPDEPEDERYYQGVADSYFACILKAADRCANLEDAAREVQMGREKRRWARYVERTYSDVLPVYKSLPYLREQIEQRLRSIDTLLKEQAAV